MNARRGNENVAAPGLAHSGHAHRGREYAKAFEDIASGYSSLFRLSLITQRLVAAELRPNPPWPEKRGVIRLRASRPRQ